MIVGSPIKLNLIPSGVMPVVYINQSDAGYDKEFLIYNGDSPYNIPAGVSATIRGKKSDGYGVTEAAVLTTGSNLVTVTVTEQMVAAEGTNLYELVFVDTGGLRVATINMVWAVKADALGDAVISDSDLDYASQVLNQLQGVSAFKNQLDINTQNIATETLNRESADTALQRNIEIEAATRQASDSNLQSNLNIETNNRATADANLQAQINNIIAPSGSAPSAAEVENARIGINNITYSTLGEAIRNQVEALNVMADQPKYTWTFGSVIGSDGIITANSAGAYSNRILVGGNDKIVRVTPTKDSNNNILIIHINQYEGDTFVSRTSLTDQGLTLNATTTSIAVNFARQLSTGIVMTQADINTYFNIELYRAAAVLAEMTSELKAVEISQADSLGIYGGVLANLISNTYVWTAKSWWDDAPDNMASFFYVFNLGSPSLRGTMTTQGTQIAVSPSTGAMAMRRITGGSWTTWAILSPGYQSNPKYYAFGDSLTYGAVWDSDPNTPLYRGEWNDLIPTRIANAVGCMDFINGGVSGARFVKQSASDTSVIIGDRIKSIDLSGYDIVTIGGGRNDSATALGNGDTATANDGTICGAVVDILDYLTTTYPKMQIVMYGVTPQPDGVNIEPEYIYTRVFSGGWSLNSYYTEMRKVCARYGIPFIDWYDCPLILRWGVLSGGYNEGTRNWSHPLSSDIYKQMGNYIGGKVSSYYKG